MTTLSTLPSMSYVEALIDSLCTRVIFGGITHTIYEASTESAATQAVGHLISTDHQANFRFSDKHQAWLITVYH